MDWILRKSNLLFNLVESSLSQQFQKSTKSVSADQTKKNSGASGQTKRHQSSQGSRRTRYCQQYNQQRDNDDVSRVMRNTPPNQTKAKPNLIVVPLIPIIYSPAQLHETTIVLLTFNLSLGHQGNCHDHSDGPDVVNTHFTNIVLVKRFFSPVPPYCGFFPL